MNGQQAQRTPLKPEEISDQQCADGYDETPHPRPEGSAGNQAEFQRPSVIQEAQAKSEDREKNKFSGNGLSKSDDLAVVFEARNETECSPTS